MVILDEVGMTDDAHLVAVTARIEAAGAKLVLVGDHHQLGAVGPGGALAALVRRHPDIVHHLTENRRQHDPAERGVLAELRDGHVGHAVAWYAARAACTARPTGISPCSRRSTLGRPTSAGGHVTGLYAWRRANVAALNQRARQWMQATGRLSGPELVCAGGNAYRAGDHVITLAPAIGRLVTSQRAVVTAVDPVRETLTLRTDDGQPVHLDVAEAGSDRLGYGYATTVHRGQGSTTDRAHLFADGGGRELAYVAMSRARQSTQVWTVADDLAQAVDDLRRDWSTQRTPTWAIDTALPNPASLTRDLFQALPSDQQARVAALLRAETALAGNAITGVGLPDRAATLGQAETALAQARQARADLDTGRGVWQTTEAGRAVQDLAQARQARERAERAVDQSGRWRDRHAARKEARAWAQRELDAQQRWEAHVAPTITRLDQEITLHQTTLDRAANGFEHQHAASRAAIDHGLQQQRCSKNLAQRVRGQRDHLDGLPTDAEVRRDAVRREQLGGIARVPQHQTPAPASPGIDL